MCRISIALLLLLLSACASAKKVPEVEAKNLPDVKFSALNPRTIQISVKNGRKINQEAGNSTQVEDSIRKTLADVLIRAGLAVKDSSQNKLHVEIADYVASDAEGECVKIASTLKSRRGASLKAEGFACHYLKHITGIQLGGDISEAYSKALRMTLDYLEQNQKQMLDGNY